MLVIEQTTNAINTDEIGRGSLTWAKHLTWEEGRTGIVENVDKEKILVRFLPVMQNIQSHFQINIAELTAGKWTLRYSSDGLETVVAYGGDESGSDESGA